MTQILRVAFFSSHQYDVESFEDQLSSLQGDLDFKITYLEPRLEAKTVPLAKDHDAVVLFVNDTVDSEVLVGLKAVGVKFIALRCAGFNNVDLKKAEELELPVARVPAYSPDAVAEFAVGMILTVIRKYHKAYNRVREGNFLLDGLLGFNIKSSTVGIIGTGKIGMITGKILSQGFGARVVAYDPYPNPTIAQEYGITYVEQLDELLAQSDIISLHCPLTPENKYLINDAAIAKMKKDVVLVNTSRGALVNTKALIKGLKEGKIKAVGMDVYEKEGEYFFRDGSSGIMQDDTLARLISFNNVFISGHQAFLTKEALAGIASTTLENLKALGQGQACPNLVKA